MLICPICKKELKKNGLSYTCPSGHTFDISNKGYTNLLLNHPNGGDNKEMVNARFLFLQNGYYSPLKEKIASIVKEYNISSLADLGCGTGYYSSNLNTIVYGFDISKEAIIKASKNKENQYFVSSSSNVPLKDEAVDMVLTIFAPTFEEEIYRILKRDGIFVLVTPLKNHLIELKESLYNNPYLNSEKEVTFNNLEIIKKEELTYVKEISQDDLINLIKMTPYFYKTDPKSFDNINKSMKITISFNITIYKK